MKRIVSLFVAVFALAVAAQASPDSGLCEAPPERQYPTHARALGFTVDAEWVSTHIAGLQEAFTAGCQAYGSCLSVWGNPVDFCRLRLTHDLRTVCKTRFDDTVDFRGWQQCRAVADVFSVAQLQSGQRAWRALQEQAAASAASAGIPAPVIRIDPEAPEPGVGGSLTVSAFHPETGAPMHGLVAIEGIMKSPTFESFSFVMNFVRVQDELGRISLRSPVIVVQAMPARDSGAPPFSPVHTTFSTPLPSNTLEFDPPAERWVAGRNLIRVTARELQSGERLEGRILRPGGVLGAVNERIPIELRDDGSSLCGEPLWFRPDVANRPDTSLPIAPCR